MLLLGLYSLRCELKTPYTKVEFLTFTTNLRNAHMTIVLLGFVIHSLHSAESFCSFITYYTPSYSLLEMTRFELNIRNINNE
jgi:hypothetical protein